MSTIDRGNQSVFVDFKQDLISQNFNQYLRGILKAGVHSGATLTTDGNNIKISPFTAFFNSKVFGTSTDTLAVIIKTASQVTLDGSEFIDNAKTVLCMKYEWRNTFQNFVDFYVRAPATSPDDNEIIIGNVEYSGVTVIGFNYTGRDYGVYDGELDIMNLPETFIRGNLSIIGNNTFVGDTEITGDLGVEGKLTAVSFGVSNLEQDTTGGIDLSTYEIDNVYIKSEPVADITITITNVLLNGKKLTIFNQSENIVILSINATTHYLIENQIIEFISDGTTMKHIYNAQTFIAPGMSMFWNSPNDPSTYGIRALPMQGQGILVDNYKSLVQVCYVGDGLNATVAAAGGFFYRALDAAGANPDPVGSYFILPETRGYVPRGLDDTGLIDPAGATRYLGDSQADQLQGHRFFIMKNSNNGLIATPFVSVTGSDAAAQRGSNLIADTGSTSDPITDGTNGAPRTGSETRMKNFSTKYVIFY